MPSAPKGRNNTAQANGLGENVYPDESYSSPEGARYVTGASAGPLKRVARGWYLALSGLPGNYGVFSDPGRLAWASLFRPFGASILTATPRVPQEMWDTLIGGGEGGPQGGGGPTFCLWWG